MVTRLIALPVAAYVALMAFVAVLVSPPLIGWIGLGVVTLVGVAVVIGGSVLFQHSRVNADRPARRDAALRLLVVADGSVPAAAAQQVAAAKPDEVFVVAPVLSGPLHFLADDEGAERREAELRLRDLLAQLERAGIPSRGVVGVDDPLEAIGDALAIYPATELLVVSSGHETWLEDGLETRAASAFGLQLLHA